MFGHQVAPVPVEPGAGGRQPEVPPHSFVSNGEAQKYYGRHGNLCWHSNRIVVTMETSLKKN